MAYATKDDVTADLSFNFTTTSNPTGTQVDGFVADASDDIDSVLSGMGYSSLIPISSTTYPRTFQKLKNITILGAAADVWSTRTKGSPNVSEKEKSFRDRFNKELENLRKFPGDLSSELVVSEGNISLPTGHFLDEATASSTQDPRYEIPENIYKDNRY